MKRICFPLLSIMMIFAGCSFAPDSTEYTGTTETSETPELTEDSESDDSTSEKASDYEENTTTTARAVIAEDLYSNFIEDATVYINFSNENVTARIGEDDAVTASAEETSIGMVSDTKVTISLSTNTLEDSTNNIDEASDGVIIQYKGSGKIKYVLSGTYSGTVFIKNKKADSAVILNNADITSSKGAGPVLRFSSEQRTFISVASNSTNTLTDSRSLNQTNTMYDDKKGSVYSKGALIFTGVTAGSNGTLNIINSGYKHAVYSKDYIRIADGLNLNISVKSTTGRDCIRALNAVIIDGGNINLTGKGTIEDDESVGIKVEGEDADEDDMTVEYTKGAGFVIINGGNLTINTVAKGITAHWKSAKSVIGNASYTEIVDNSLLCSTFLSGTTLTTPDPYVEINGGTINITTTGEPYEGRTDSDPSCSPEGIEAKGSLTINAGTITLNCTDDAINAGGNITINGGAIYACSSKNDAIDSNGTNGITINGGIIVALGTTVPECAFDCDNNPFTINGGIVIGLGSSNYTKPQSGNQSTGVIASSHFGNSNSTMAVIDKDGSPVFAYTLPSSTGEIMIFSTPNIITGNSYTIKKGVTVSGGTVFHGLYTSLPQITGGTNTITDFSTSDSNKIYTDSSAGNGISDGGFNPTDNQDLVPPDNSDMPDIPDEGNRRRF